MEIVHTDLLLISLVDCHATGFFGATGRGSPEHQGVEGRVDVINSTLGKALGGWPPFSSLSTSDGSSAHN